VSTTLERPVERAPLNEVRDWRFLGRSADFWLCAGMTALVLIVQGWNITGFPSLSDDEGTYMSQAWAIDHGIGMAPYTYWFDHPPLGWIQISALSWLPALIFHAPGQLVVAYGRLVMLPYIMASSILVYVLSRRMELPKWAAALAVALFGLSPLAVTLQREVFLDNIAVTWILAALVLAYSPRKHLWHHVAAGFCGGIAVLSKETVLLAIPALVVALWQNAHPDTRKYSYFGFLGAFLLLAIQYPLYATLKGELWASNNRVSLIGGIKYQFTRPGSGSILNPASNAHTVLQNWLFYDPVIITAGVTAVILALAFRQLRPIAIGGVVIALMALRSTGYLPAMYIIQALPFFAIAIAGLASQLVTFLLRFKARPILWQRATRLALVAVCFAAAGFYFVPTWYRADRDADTENVNVQYSQAAAWVTKNIPHPGNQRIVVDDSLWLNMVQDGFKAGHYDIYFFKLDLDPAVMKALPGPKADKWKDVQWIVTTPYMVQNESSIPTLKALVDHSKLVKAFGPGGINNAIEVRKIVP